MSSQGDDWTESLIRGILPEPSQEQIEKVLTIIIEAKTDIMLEAEWPSRFHIFRPGEVLVEGRTWEEYVAGLLVPVRGPVDLWRQAARRERKRGSEE